MLTHLEIVIRIALAAVLGSIVGFERERLLWSAGIRTHMMVCVGACLFMIVSAFGFSDALVYPHVVLDPSRVAAGVVSGVGFLGAGSILARGEVVRGLTTAASVWTVAAIGLASGGGMYFAAALSTLMIVAILAGVKPLEEAYRERNQTCHLNIEAEHGAVSLDTLQQVLGVREKQVKRFYVNFDRDAGRDIVQAVIGRVPVKEISRFTHTIGSLPGVHTVKSLGRGGRSEQSSGE